MLFSETSNGIWFDFLNEAIARRHELCPPPNDLTDEDIHTIKKYMELFEENLNDTTNIEKTNENTPESNGDGNEKSTCQEIECEDEQIFLERISQLSDVSPTNSVPDTPSCFSNSLPSKSTLGVVVTNDNVNKRESICGFFREAFNDKILTSTPKPLNFDKLNTPAIVKSCMKQNAEKLKEKAQKKLKFKLEKDDNSDNSENNEDEKVEMK